MIASVVMYVCWSISSRDREKITWYHTQNDLAKSKRVIRKIIPTTQLDRVFVDARAQTWQHVASMEDRCRQCLPPQGMVTNTRPWRCGKFVWILGKKHCALKFENKQGFGTCPKSFFGGKKCKTSSLLFRIQWIQYSGVLHAGVNRLSLGSNREGCVQGLKSLKGFF